MKFPGRICNDEDILSGWKGRVVRRFPEGGERTGVPVKLFLEKLLQVLKEKEFQDPGGEI
ncbi:MAG TPA: hypothetical protein PK200_12940 [Spirochaetota bacterium]|nr:hypothetical protein [Spirochaetota bacterium]HQO02954.1 hypothetical protein [Spirochaetota bacterium]HQP48784.1 hypothetical protein [Spirochaetota bacterium]